MSGIQEGDVVTRSRLERAGWDRKERIDEYENTVIAYEDPDSNLQAVQVGTNQYKVSEEAFATRGTGGNEDEDEDED